MLAVSLGQVCGGAGLDCVKIKYLSVIIVHVGELDPQHWEQGGKGSEPERKGWGGLGESGGMVEGAWLAGW